MIASNVIESAWKSSRLRRSVITSDRPLSLQMLSNISHADSIDNVGMTGRLQCRGTVEMREVMQRHGLELTELLHYGIYLPGVRSLGVEDGLRIIKEYNHLSRG